MSGEARLSTWLRPARRRRFANDTLTGTPAALLLAALTWRRLGVVEAALLGSAALAIGLLIAHRNAHRYDRRWLTRRLDAHRPDADDSTELLFADEEALGPLQRLQRARLEKRLAGEDALELRPAWRTRRITICWAVAIAAALALALVPPAADPVVLAPSHENIVVPPGVPRLVGQHLRIVPPAYTGLPTHGVDRLDARAPQGSQLTWTLRFDPQPEGAALAFHDGTREPLRRDGDVWTATHRLDRSVLYRVIPAGAPARPLPPLHRLDAVLDAPPSLRVIAPERGVTIYVPGQAGWPLLFEATDNYGVAGAAQLRITVTEGEGENITFKERTVAVGGSGPPRRRRFVIRLNPRALGIARGNEIVAQLTVRDMKAPLSHVVRSPSLILRWPPEPPMQGAGLEGLLKKTIPAYFRSQRQIIIDAEKLLRERRRLTERVFLERSDALGVDQRLLRLRYGKFLGEVASNGPAAPTNDEPAPEPVGGDHDDHADAVGGGAATTFGNAADVLGEYGHTHDESEAATLIDPETRGILKEALDQMWQSELHLRQGAPKQALPFAYKALGFIKQVQQASRIYLARVGPVRPPIDEARRMTGKRDGLERRPLPPIPAVQVAEAPMRAWQALAVSPGLSTPVPLDALERWLGGNEARVPDALSIVAAIDAVRQKPDCAPCRARLRGLLWAALPHPPAKVLRRDDGDAAGRRYLEALRRRL